MLRPKRPSLFIIVILFALLAFGVAGCVPEAVSESAGSGPGGLGEGTASSPAMIGFPTTDSGFVNPGGASYYQMCCQTPATISVAVNEPGNYVDLEVYEDSFSSFYASSTVHVDGFAENVTDNNNVTVYFIVRHAAGGMATYGIQTFSP